MSDEELLRVRLCDLGVKIEGSEIEPRVQKLYSCLEARGIPVPEMCGMQPSEFVFGVQ